MDKMTVPPASDKIPFYRQTMQMGEVQQDGTITWNETRVEDFAYNSDGSFGGPFLGGYEIRNGQKTTWNSDWSIASTEVDTASIVLIELTAAEKSSLPSSFSQATHKQVSYYDNENLGLVVSPQDGTAVTLKGDGEALYFKKVGDADPTLVGRENFYSFVDLGQG